jgi:signal transduction histidine kinase
MLAGVAHELRNPLGGVEIFSHLLNKELTEADNKKNYVQKIIHEVAVMKKILTDFLEFARPKNPQPEMCNIEKLIDEVRLIFSQDIEQKGIALQTMIAEKHTFADPGHLRQILVNLIENAIQSLHGNGVITIATQAHAHNVEIVIEDNGPGIEENIKEKIFDPFFTTKERGSGLGLAIVKKLVEENRGDIRVVANERQGTRCVVSFPKNETTE